MLQHSGADTKYLVLDAEATTTATTSLEAELFTWISNRIHLNPGIIASHFCDQGQDNYSSDLRSFLATIMINNAHPVHLVQL